MENNKLVIRTPSVKRRLVSMLYDSLLLLAVEMLAIFIYLVVTLNNHSPIVDTLRYLFIVFVAGAYFVHFWTDSGHTLAMKTWRIKLVKVGYAKVPRRDAIKRFIFAWGFVAPALLISWVLQLRETHAGSKTAFLLLLANIILWSLTAFLDKDRQFLHDRLAGTRLIELPKPAKK
ncbi:RDD family protein [Pseudoduganella sp. GCM10020061]|uniref:RDD family protein n=1 Tax=Pseudoduganella sp. GCM10020061 TaxID=3317345 RepID=UPI0036425C7E